MIQEPLIVEVNSVETTFSRLGARRGSTEGSTFRNEATTPSLPEDLLIGHQNRDVTIPNQAGRQKSVSHNCAFERTELNSSTGLRERAIVSLSFVDTMSGLFTVAEFRRMLDIQYEMLTANDNENLKRLLRGES